MATTKKSAEKEKPAVKKEEKATKTKEVTPSKSAKTKGEKAEKAAKAEVVVAAPPPPPPPPPKPAAPKVKVAIKETASGAKIYQPAGIYAVGQQLFHPVWQAEGLVIEVGDTTDGHSKILVDFPDLGIKRLVADHPDIKF